MRAKRQRTSGRQPRSGQESIPEDQLLQMDPSLMTERQQLAFLLRTTATASLSATKDSSNDASSQADDESEQSENELNRANRVKKTKQIKRKSPPSASSRRPTQKMKASRDDQEQEAQVVQKDTSPEASVHRQTDATKFPDRPRSKKLKVMTSDAGDGSSSSTEEQDSTSIKSLASDRIRHKTSPSSTNDVVHMQVFAPSDASGFWSLDECALCCDRHHVPSTDALFLCSSCERKYPTQRALGIV